MNLKSLDEIKQDGLTVFMPSGIQATLFLQEDNVLVQYPNLQKDTYSKKDFEKIMDEGIFIFNDMPQNFPQIIESLNEEKGLEAGNPNLEHIGEQVEQGIKSGYEPYEFGNWKLETSLDNKWEKLSSKLKEYLMEDISYPIKDGFLKYNDLEIICNKNYLTKEELESLDWFTDEQINDESIEELSAYIDYEIIADKNIDDDLQESVLNKLNKKGFIRESLMKKFQENQKDLSFLGLNQDEFRSKTDLINYIENNTDYDVIGSGDYWINIIDRTDKDGQEIQVNLEHKMREAFEKTKRKQGDVFKAVKSKKKEYVTPEFKVELLNSLDKIAKECPNVKLRQQAQTFIDELGLQEYYDIKKVQNFINKNIKILNAKVNESADELKEYKLKIIVGRDRDSDGELIDETIKAKNDVDALIQVFNDFNLQNSDYINGEYEDEDLTEEELANKNKVIEIAKTGENIEEGVKILTDLYFNNFDISDYYDDIISLTAPDGHVVIEDDIDLEEWFGEEEDWDDDEDEDLEEAFKLKDKKKKKKKLDELNGEKVRDWYINEFPTDELGKDIKANITFEDVFNNLPNVYDILGVGDSIIRERVFEKLAELKNVDYDTIYYKWLGEKVNEAINEDVYKVYNSIEGKECGVFNSWNDIEEFLNREWGDYKASMAKENPNFGTDEEKDLFFANYEFSPVQLPVAVEVPAEDTEIVAVEAPQDVIETPAEVIEAPAEEVEICPDCGQPKGTCGLCHLDSENCEGCADIEVPEDAEEIDIEEIITEMCSQKVKKDEDFKDGMITDINELDFPDAMHDAVDTKEDGSLLRLQDVFNMIKELKGEIEGIKTDIKDALGELKQGIKDDVKDIQADVNSKLDNTDSKISDLTSEEEAEEIEEEPIEEEPVEETPAEETEEAEENIEESFKEMRSNVIYKQIKTIVESNKHPQKLISVATIAEKLREDYGTDIKAECTYNLIKAICEKAPEFKSNIVDAKTEKTTLKECMLGKAAKWLGGGLMASLAQEKEKKNFAIIEQMRKEVKNEDTKEIQQEIDKLHAQGKNDKIKATIDVMADNEQEQKDAEKYALDKVQESKAQELISKLKQTSKTAAFSNLNFRG